MDRIDQLARLLDRHTAALGPGFHDTAIARVSLIRSEQPSDRMHTVYNPSVCIVAQGEKRSIAGSSILNYGPGQYLTVSVDLPVIGEVTKASADWPYLVLKLELDPARLGDLLMENCARGRTDEEPDLGVTVSPLSPEMLDAAIRLASLLDRPDAIPALGPLYERELCFFLLTGPQGARLRQILLAGSRTAQIVAAIRWIAEHYREPFSVEEVAARAGMSPSSFHHHFKAVTAQSPLQYQKLLRLQEARRQMVVLGSDAASAGFSVGYSSPQQFSREYARLFGAPPQRDAARMRAEANRAAFSAGLAATA